MCERPGFRRWLSRVSAWVAGELRVIALFIILVVLALTPDLTLGNRTVLALLSLPAFLIIVHGIYRAGKGYEYKILFPEVAEAGYYPENTKEAEGDE